MLEPDEDDALRAVKRGEADDDQWDLYFGTVRPTRARQHWFLCDCRYEDGERPTIVPRRNGPNRIFLVNRPNPPLPHAEGCVFGPTVDEEDRSPLRRRAPQTAYDNRLNPFAPAETMPDGDEDRPMGDGAPRTFTGLSAGAHHRTPSNMLRVREVVFAWKAMPCPGTSSILSRRPPHPFQGRETLAALLDRDPAALRHAGLPQLARARRGFPAGVAACVLSGRSILGERPVMRRAGDGRCRGDSAAGPRYPPGATVGGGHSQTAFPGAAALP